MFRRTGRTVSTTKRGPMGVVTTTEHYVAVEGGATDEELTNVIAMVKAMRALVRRSTN